ncbi:MAG: hypothetical protein A2Z12_10320 [Actinobacteria bacterium RBG_16_68_21]|nr:MAG: hypothetical protein A2Z12_10320 [Actinobacteria bacterium RBG_16_68_21]
MRAHQRLARGAAAVLLGISLVGGSLAGTALADDQTIPPGYDLFETDPQTTHFDFQGPAALPAGFFGPGSEPFSGQINFAGAPVATFGGHNTGDADTIVRRPRSAMPGAPDPIDIELVALSLVSVQPITVTYTGMGTHEWEVNVGLSPTTPSKGQMRIYGNTTEGGTFDSQLQVVPLFTFTRLFDGFQVVLDGSEMPPQILMAEGVPWRPGCELPALAVPGLNDGFCPSFDGDKVLTMEEALLATHGVRPAQPALEHFKCYTVTPTRFENRTVQLTDQFGTRSAQVTDRTRLCNPARKNNEPYSNKRAHLVCYAAPGPELNTTVAVRNQFGSQRLLVHKAETLCVPSKKREIGDPFRGIRVPIDHFQCYSVEAVTGLQRLGQLGAVNLKDQFGRTTTQVGNAVQLCTPVDKDGSTIQHPVSHLVCYQITGPEVNTRVQFKNQFERTKIKAIRPELVCVPSAKVVVS